MWIVQVIEGAFCLLMGVVTLKYDAPDGTRPKVIGQFYIEQDDELYDVKYNTCPGSKNYMVPSCGTINQQAKKVKKICQWVNGTLLERTDFDLPKFFLLGDTENEDCIRNQDLVGIVVLIMICF